MTLKFKTDVVHKYQKKPEEVEAIQYLRDSTSWEILEKFTNYLIRIDAGSVMVYSREDAEWFELDEGDFIVKTADDDLYPYDGDAFQKDFILVPTYTATTNLVHYPPGVR